MTVALPTFPSDFLWGTATAAYQIEGAAHDGGRGPSIWDTFSHTPGAVRDGHTGDIACDHYHRWPQDVDLLAGLGVNAYRFSIAWPRIQPDGSGPANPAGLDFYERLVDALLARGIAPTPTLYHWDLPQALEDDGGWTSRDTAARFGEYAALVAARLADRVPRWTTLNEPFVQFAAGYAIGRHAPGRTLLLKALPVAHHLLLGHGLAVAALRAAGAGNVMITNNYTPVYPASDTPADVAAAATYDLLHNRLFTDPILRGRYPDLSPLDLDGIPGTAGGDVATGDLATTDVATGDLATTDVAARDLATTDVATGDLAVIAAPLDGLGVNYYNPTWVAAPGPQAVLPFELVATKDYPTTGFGWPVVPGGLRTVLTHLTERYGQGLPPVYVTENGCSYPDVVGPDGTVHDPDRVTYLDAHLRALHAAMDAGIDVRGYFVWSLLDNFEWAEGYHQRFGLVHVDFDTQVRTPKDSYHWLRETLAARR